MSRLRIFQSDEDHPREHNGCNCQARFHHLPTHSTHSFQQTSRRWRFLPVRWVRGVHHGSEILSRYQEEMFCNRIPAATIFLCLVWSTHAHTVTKPLSLSYPQKHKRTHPVCVQQRFFLFFNECWACIPTEGQCCNLESFLGTSCFQSVLFSPCTPNIVLSVLLSLSDCLIH